MSKRRNVFFNKRGRFSVNPKRPVSFRTKMACISALCSFLVLALSVSWSAYTSGDGGKIAGGIGFVFLAIEIMWTAVTAMGVKNDIEPVVMRVLSVVLSAAAALVLTAVYIMGIIRR